MKPSSVDGILLDLGVSSMQLDRKERGFAYRQDGPLDMRMNQKSKLATAADYVNTLNQRDLATILAHFGIHKFALAAQISGAILDKRKELGKLESTAQLVEVIEGLVPAAQSDMRKKMIKSTFQALRIAVNNEARQSTLPDPQLLSPLPSPNLILILMV